ncbi:uncharacterized protein A1O9_11970 [Exophiala aquamarina CBS 119918]|uniref:TauD/TfdA-like domain-containing protein n=1 Tax=Exophiala aquamarina CBS 119918 TaxID=1182545 RepID=A0A072P8S1_9EURO|nr:uncharacterized protein A1O9_11970 [Exophiala aquamarina CBS 119918]KEF51980.1 hypothetical protein A1O9_11970 [Exophiala aquamarina CBS 119918]
MGSIAASIPIVNGGSKPDARYPQPLKQSGTLDKFESEDVTPVIGREFPSANFVDDFLNAADSDNLLRDLAITISERGVVFFRAQDNLSNDLQKHFIQRLGEVTGKPLTSTLHIHHVLNGPGEFGDDSQISNISSVHRRKLLDVSNQQNKRQYDAAQWHSDIQFERVPADYSNLRLIELPKTGGDTLWASGYEIYERFSEPVQTFLEGLTGYFLSAMDLSKLPRQGEQHCTRKLEAPLKI